MKTKYEEAYEQLNEAQRHAVTKIDGPVLVIAGPGTGKTQLLSMRVANILKSTDAKPSNILCLTFTNKASVNMKERIIDLAGHEGAKVVASTFHSFASEIMNTYPDHFWNAASLSVAPEPVQLDAIESIISQLPLDNPLALKFAGQYTLLDDIQRAINLAKDAGLTPDKLRAIINFNLAYIDSIESKLVEILSRRLSAKNLDSLGKAVNDLAKHEIDSIVYPLTSLSTVLADSLRQAVEQDSGSGKATNTSSWKKRWVQTVNGQRGMFDEQRRNDWWLKLADVYERYRELLHLRGFYDYADMLVETISQLEQNPEMLADVQERFSYVLIDEFQDTNPAQLRLAHLVSDHHSANGKPNLMAVGDDDQSIFKFNGAELNNMLGFKRSYPSAETIVLTKNYRSSQALLDTAKRIIEQAENRVVNSDNSLSKNLVAENPPSGNGTIKAVAYSSRELQLSEIAREIKKTYSSKQTTAVLARGHASLIKMAGLLQTLNIPIRYEQQSNILDHEIINQVYLLSKLLLAIQNGNVNEINGSVHKIIRHPMWGIEPKELWDLAISSHNGGNWLESLLTSPSDDLKAIGNWYVWLAQQASSQPLAITIEHIIGLRWTDNYASPVKSYFVDNNATRTNKYFHGLSAIQLLRALVHEFGKDSEPTIEELVRFIEINKNNNKILADESPFITGGHAVQLLSVHKAKGLEFDQVYIIDATEDNWQPKKGGRKPPANLPLQPVGDDFDDYVRLMYVAMTRAKSSLTVSSYYQDHAGKEVAISSIIQSAFSINKISTDNKQKIIEVLEENLHWPELSGGLEAEMLKARLENYSLSVTHLLNFLDLSKGGPEYFKERNLLRLPETKSVSLSYGTAMHSALDKAQKLTNKNNFSLKAVVSAFNKSLATEHLAKVDNGRFQRQGQQTLTRLFNNFNYRPPKGSTSERKIKNVRLDRALISGNLDRVDSDGDNLKIIDYKTGSPLNNFNTKDKNKAIKAYKHKIQLIFYALLMSEYLGPSKPMNIEGQMVYVEAESQNELVRPYTPSKDDTEHLRRLIDAVWSKITNLELPDISSYPKDINGILAFEQDLIKERR